MNRAGLGVFFLILPALLFSEESFVSFQFDRESWNIGLEGLSGSLSSEQEYLKKSIPYLLKQELSSSEIHILSSDEKNRYRTSMVEEADKELIAQLSQNYSSRDQLLFSNDSTSDSLDSLDSINETISELDEERLKLAFTDKSLISSADMLNVEWIKVDDDDEYITPDRFSPAVTAQKYDLDFLISGEIREIEGYYLLDIYGFLPSSEGLITIYSGTGSIDDIESMAKHIANELRSIILGRAWAILTVETDDPDALIYSDGELIGIGSAELKTAEPGTVLLEAIGEDNSYWSSEAELTALVINDYSGLLSPVETEFLKLDSNPSGSDVYIGARWAGKTPLNLPRYHERNIWVTVKADGYYDKSFEVSTESPETMFFDLVVEELSEQEIFDLSKNNFYKSLGRFTISLVGPVVTGGIFSNYASKYNSYAYEYASTSDTTYYDLAEEMERNYYISYGVFWGTIGLSSGLLVDVFVKLSRYIKAAEALAE